MKWYRIILRPLSALRTPLYADTLWGHICWGIVWHEGEEKLREFFESYESGKPPFLLSDVFPHGYLPMPFLKKEMKAENSDALRKQVETRKKIKKMQYIPLEWFQEKLSVSMIINKLEREGSGGSYLITDFSQEETRVHNVVNRKTGTTGENSLYNVEERWYKPGTSLDVYVWTEETKERIETLFGWGLENGFGADASTGKGRLVVEGVEEVTNWPTKGNRYMALAHFVPAYNEGIDDLRADIFVRHGKVGGVFGLYDNPFKKPIVMYTSGATMKFSQPREWIGTLLKNVHREEKIRHYAYALVIPYQEDEE